jgi:hypothetical protein
MLNEISQLLGGVIAFVEHGEDILKAGQKDVDALEAGEPSNHVDQLLSPPPDEPEPAPATAVPPPPGAPADTRDEEIASLRQQLANAQAQLGRTEASVTTDEPPPPPVAGV